MADPSDDVEDKLSLSRPFKRSRKRPARAEARGEAPASPPADASAGARVDVPSGMPAPDDGAEQADDSAVAWETGPALDSGPIPGFVPPLPPSEEEVAASAEPEPVERPEPLPASPRAEPTDPDPVEPPPASATDAVVEQRADAEPWRQRVDLLPMLPTRVAALVTGAVVGLLGVALTSAGLKGCSTVKGTSTCGGPGFFLLLAIVIVMALLGAVLLTVWEISRPGSTSILAVALVAVLSQLFLVDVLFSAWMFAVIPVLSAIGYLAAWWLTSTFADEQSTPAPG